MLLALLFIWSVMAGVLLGCRDDGTSPRASGPMRIAWHTPLPFSGQSFWLGRPAVDGGRVFVQDGNLLLGLNANTGAVLWSRPVRRTPSPPVTRLLARD